MRLMMAALACSLLLMGAGNDPEYEAYRIYVNATHYCPGPCCCGDSADGITATGSNAYRKGVAVAKDAEFRVLPLGTRIDVPEYGAWIPIDDVGGAVTAGQIDIRVPTHALAVSLGTKRIKIRVWRKK
jgi:3D (Asp-Asp-Asp) domain-containing protein